VACTGFDGVLVKRPDHEIRWRKIGDDTGSFAGFRCHSCPLEPARFAALVVCFIFGKMKKENWQRVRANPKVGFKFCEPMARHIR
jgi:hypothetical protein